jgi:transmembrane sensor
MKSMSVRTRFVLIGLAVVFLSAAGVALWKQRHEVHHQALPDGTEVFFRSGSTIEPARAFPRSRELKVDGEILLRTRGSSSPLIVRSRLLVLTITGEALLRITAYSKESGEQAEVLRGNVIAHKAYRSPYSEPDKLSDGQMVMINQTIDLMEKETMHADELAALREWISQMLQSSGSVSQ